MGTRAAPKEDEAHGVGKLAGDWRVGDQQGQGTSIGMCLNVLRS